MADRALVATRKGLFTIRRAEDGWRIADAAFLGDNVSIALADPRDGAIYAALDHGHFGVKLHRSADQGSPWEELTVPTYPVPGPGDEEPPHPFGGPSTPWKLLKIWALEPGSRDEPGRLWCGTIPGGLFRSDDAGRSWTLIESLWRHPGRKRWLGGGAEFPGIHSVCVDPCDPASVYVGVSCGGVWHTTDAGATWACRATGMRAEFMPPDMQYDPGIQDAHRLVQCRSSPDHFWVQHHNGIFRSTDGSESWQEITTATPSAFGFAAAVHPTDPNRAWFVPGIKDEKRIPVDGKLVVTRTRDGGKTFDVLSKGLPQQHAYHLVYRHALDIDPAGETLAFGSTTGSLWVSEDQGDSWQTISNDLPPIHAVRFAG